MMAKFSCPLVRFLAGCSATAVWADGAVFAGCGAVLGSVSPGRSESVLARRQRYRHVSIPPVSAVMPGCGRSRAPASSAGTGYGVSEAASSQRARLAAGSPPSSCHGEHGSLSTEPAVGPCRGSRGAARGCPRAVLLRWEVTEERSCAMHDCSPSLQLALQIARRNIVTDGEVLEINRKFSQVGDFL